MSMSGSVVMIVLREDDSCWGGISRSRLSLVWVGGTV